MSVIRVIEWDVGYDLEQFTYGLSRFSSTPERPMYTAHLKLMLDHDGLRRFQAAMAAACPEWAPGAASSEPPGLPAGPLEAEFDEAGERR